MLYVNKLKSSSWIFLICRIQVFKSDSWSHQINYVNKLKSLDLLSILWRFQFHHIESFMFIGFASWSLQMLYFYKLKSLNSLNLQVEVFKSTIWKPLKSESCQMLYVYKLRPLNPSNLLEFPFLRAGKSFHPYTLKDYHYIYLFREGTRIHPYVL